MKIVENYLLKIKDRWVYRVSMGISHKLLRQLTQHITGNFKVALTREKGTTETNTTQN